MLQNIDTKTYIFEHYQTMTPTQMAKELNVCVGTVNYHIKKNGWYTKKNMFSQSDINFMKAHYLDMSYREIGQILNFTERQIRGKINNMGLKKNRDFDNRYFQNIDTDLKAYFLGFIFADGWICRNSNTRNYEFGIELQSQDKYILDHINNELGGIHLITHKEPHDVYICGKIAHSGHSDVLRVFSKPLVEDLYSHGIDTNKSCKDTIPEVPDAFFFDFLRGYIDGDGCFYINKAKQVLNMHITCASRIVLEWLQLELQKRGINTYIFCENDKKYRLFCTEHEQLQKLLANLYHGNYSLCLTRKFNIVKSFLPGLAV